ncbi:MAG: AI-2E family transporter [Acidimicrobiia bacterium]|nr:AI-2E family transporter [bacterium]MXZ68719.1 AI-2E family transporter [Acidimicrobiia bacterium]MYB45727.1 AI-2E family transporter [Acidimicrobiia bacterium]
MESEAVSTRHDGMPPWIPRVIVLVVLAFLGTYLLVWSIIRLRSFLLALLLSLFASFALEPGVDFLARRGWRRGLATSVVFAVVVVAGVVFAAVTLPPMVAESASLVSNVPGWLTDLSSLLNDRFGLNLNLSDVSAGMLDLQGSLQTYAASLASGVLGLGAQAVNLLLQMFTMALFTFYLLADGPRFRRRVLSLVRPERQAEVSRIWEIAIRKTGGYVYSRALLALISAIFTYVFLLIVAVPYALPLAVWVGVVSQFIPAVGTYLAALAPVLVALTVRPITAVVVVVGLVVYQQIENVFLSPRITARTMSLHPAVAFGSVLVGAALLGVVGVLVALPATAIIQAFVSTYVEQHNVDDEHLGASPEPPTDGPGPPAGDPAAT